MSSLIFDIDKLYQRTFGSQPYRVAQESAQQNTQPSFKINGNNTVTVVDRVQNTLQVSLNGIEIWLPTVLSNLPSNVFENGILNLPYSVVRITGSSTIIRTPLNERRGTVKEFFSIDDYKITLKGFFIDQERVWPYDDLLSLKNLHELGSAFTMDNALTNVFLNKPGAEDQQRVVITGFDLPEVEGGRKHVRPFVMQIESDSVFELEWSGQDV